MMLWTQIMGNFCLLELEVVDGNLHEAIVSTLET